MGISSNIDYITDQIAQVDKLDDKFAFFKNSFENDIASLATLDIESDATKAHQTILDQQTKTQNDRIQQINVNRGLESIDMDIKQMQAMLGQYADRLYLLDKMDESFVTKTRFQSLSNLYHQSVADYKVLKDVNSLSNITMFKDQLNETEEKYKSIKGAYMSLSNTIVNTLELTKILSGNIDIKNTIVKPLNELENNLFKSTAYASLANNLDSTFAKYKELKDMQDKIDASFKPMLDGYLQEKETLGKNIDTLVSDVNTHYAQPVDIAFAKSEWEKFLATLKPMDQNLTSGNQSFEATTVQVANSAPGSAPGEFCMGDGNDNTCFNGKQLKEALSKWIRVD